jgi:hypothetical protein
MRDRGPDRKRVPTAAEQQSASEVRPLPTRSQPRLQREPKDFEDSKVVLEVTARFPIKMSKPLIVISIASGAMCNTKHTPAVGKKQKCPAAK